MTGLYDTVKRKAVYIIITLVLYVWAGRSLLQDVGHWVARRRLACDVQRAATCGAAAVESTSLVLRVAKAVYVNFVSKRLSFDDYFLWIYTFVR